MNCIAPEYRNTHLRTQKTLFPNWQASSLFMPSQRFGNFLDRDRVRRKESGAAEKSRKADSRRRTGRCIVSPRNATAMRLKFSKGIAIRAIAPTDFAAGRGLAKSRRAVATIDFTRARREQPRGRGADETPTPAASLSRA